LGRNFHKGSGEKGSEIYAEESLYFFRKRSAASGKEEKSEVGFSSVKEGLTKKGSQPLGGIYRISKKQRRGGKEGLSAQKGWGKGRKKGERGGKILFENTKTPRVSGSMQ